MHAMVLNAVKSPLVWTELADRLPNHGEIRVKVLACGVLREWDLPTPDFAGSVA